MDQWNGACSDPSQGMECAARSSIAARKVQKADREKIRRDRLNEQLQELGNALDPDRPRNDKANILGDAIQILEHLTANVSRLKAEYASLSEESRELTQEKNELRDEKATLKSEVDGLSAQYQQRLRVLYPWTGMEPSFVIGLPPAYPLSVPIPISGTISMHPGFQAYPILRNQTSPYMPCSQPYLHGTDQMSNQLNTSALHPRSNRSRSPAQDCRRKLSTPQQASCGGRSDDFSDVATELELKTPGSAAPLHSEVANDQDSSSESTKKKQCTKKMEGSILTEGSSSSRCSPNGALEISNCVGDTSVGDNQ